jgi:hypothetical protein
VDDLLKVQFSRRIAMSSNKSIPNVSRSRGGRLWRSLLVAAAGCGAMVLSGQPTVAAQVSVDFTVREILGTQGKIIQGNLEGCAGATVWTVNPGKSQNGPITTFNGSKKIDCGGGNTLTLIFRAKTSECLPTDEGAWKVASGTGLFASAEGQGKLVGTYFLGDGPGTFCNMDGIDDRYTGKLMY